MKIAVGGGMWGVGGRSVTRHDLGMNRWAWSAEPLVEYVLPSISGQNQKRRRPLEFSSARLIIKKRFAGSDQPCAWRSKSAKRDLSLVN
jgi:hypothetical protein